MIGNSTLKLPAGARFALVEPQVPYLYVPSSDYATVVDGLKEIYQSQGLNCSTTGGYCYFPVKCESVSNNLNNLTVSVGRENQTFTFTMSIYDLLLSGTEFGHGGDSCYIPIFESPNTQGDTWYLGNLFMHRYYVVFDQTPADNGEDYLKVGFALQNTLPVKYESNKMVAIYPDDPDDGDNNGKTTKSKKFMYLIFGGGGGILLVLIVLAVCACRSQAEETERKASQAGFKESVTAGGDKRDSVHGI